MSLFEPPPTWTLPVEGDPEQLKKLNLRFSKTWLKWFIDLTSVINAAGGTSPATGTVTDVGVSVDNGLTGSVTNPTTTPTISLVMSDITPNSVKATTFICPGTPAGAQQTACHLYAGSGAPSNSNGANGDYYFRSDGTGSTHIYFKSGGTWAGII